MPFRKRDIAASTLRVVTLLMAAPALRAQLDPIPGTYSDGALTVVLEGSGGNYTGQATLQSRRFTIRLSGSAASLFGTSAENGQSQVITAALQEEMLTLAIGAKVYHLKRIAEHGGDPASMVPPVQAEPGTYLNNVDGFALRLPTDFQFAGQQAAVVLFGSKTIPGEFLVRNRVRFSEHEWLEALRAGYQDEGIQLAPASESSELTVGGGRGRVAAIRGVVDGTSVRGLAAGYIGLAGQCVIVLAVATPQEWAKFESHARQLIESVRLFTPVAPPAHEEWTQRLAGLSLNRLTNPGETDVGEASKTAYHLCSDGTFQYGEHGTVGFETAAAFIYDVKRRAGVGRWRIELRGEPTLVFAFGDGTLHTWAVSLRDNKLYLAEQQWLRGRNERCP